MSLHPRTLASIEQLRAVAWFVAVGRRDSDTAIVLGSWEEAIESCSSSEWENLLLEAANQYRERLVERAPDALSNWNARVGEVKSVTVPFVAEKTRQPRGALQNRPPEDGGRDHVVFTS